jgi:hypothetical protein
MAERASSAAVQNTTQKAALAIHEQKHVVQHQVNLSKLYKDQGDMLKNAHKYLHELLEIDYYYDCSEAMEAKSDINMWKEKMLQTCQIIFQHSVMATAMTTTAQAAATMTAGVATMMMSMIPRTASAVKKNANKPRKKDMIEIDDSSGDDWYVSSSSDDDKKLSSFVFAPGNGKENANAKNTSSPKKKKQCVHDSSSDSDWFPMNTTMSSLVMQ